MPSPSTAMAGLGSSVSSSPPLSATPCAAHITYGTAKRSTSQPPLMRASAIPACSRPSGGSACLPRQRERQVQLHTVVHHLRYDAAPLAPFETDQAVAFHCAQGAREVGLGFAGDACQFVER